MAVSIARLDVEDISGSYTEKVVLWFICATKCELGYSSDDTIIVFPYRENHFGHYEIQEVDTIESGDKVILKINNNGWNVERSASTYEQTFSTLKKVWPNNEIEIHMVSIGKPGYASIRVKKNNDK